MTPIFRVLAVDDDVASAELIVRISERFGYDAFATSDSRGVLNLCGALRPDVLAVDINMPNVDAAQLIDMLARASFGGKILIVSGEAQSVLNEHAELARSLGLGVISTLQKPFDVSMLRKLLQQESLSLAA
ncbi:response regulator [Rhizobiaceae bacterium]|nr:response regulator [Rhizobiaceae bacterium]